VGAPVGVPPDEVEERTGRPLEELRARLDELTDQVVDVARMLQRLAGEVGALVVAVQHECDLLAQLAARAEDRTGPRGAGLGGDGAADGGQGDSAVADAADATDPGSVPRPRDPQGCRSPAGARRARPPRLPQQRRPLGSTFRPPESDG
jgi:hypothetical protein